MLPSFWPVWGEGIREVVPADSSLDDAGYRYFYRADQRYTVWVTSRNARTWLTRPWALFDGEHCHPAARSIAYGESGLSFSLLALPFYWTSFDPILTFNLTFFASLIATGLAMFLVVRRFTANDLAALTAALIIALHPERIRDPAHPYIYDLSALPLALLFAQRFFAKGRTRDGLALAACVAYQLGTTFYALAAAATIGLCLLGWLLLRYRLTALRPVPLLATTAAVAVGVAAIYGPYLGVFVSGGLEERPTPLHTPLGALAPGGLSFPGLLTLGLACLGLAGPAPRTGAGAGAKEGPGNPGPALLLGALCCLVLAAGPQLEALGLPNVFGWLAAHVPGFASVRAPTKILNGAYYALALLAGFGTAQLCARLPSRRHALVLGLACALLAAVQTRLPGIFATPPHTRLQAERIIPSESLLAGYDALAAMGNRGPVLELPLAWGGAWKQRFAVQQVQGQALLASAYHQRRTSACLSSNIPPERAALGSVQERLPHADAFEQARAAGFTAVVLQNADRRPLLAQKLWGASQGSDPQLELVYDVADTMAFRLLPSPGTGASGAPTKEPETR